MKIAFQGERGSFSEIITNRLYNESILFPCKNFKDIFDKVNSQVVDLGVIPVENSLTGRIREPTNLLTSSSLNIINEGLLKIEHSLISESKIAIENIKEIYGHPEALIQCKEFLSTLNCKVISWYDGAGASTIIKELENSGLVASEKVAELYGLTVIKKGIQDSKENTTRFFVISKSNTSPTGNDKTSLLLSTHHKPGALFKALESIEENQINLTRLESIPVKDKPWQYMFLIDFEGHQFDPKIKNALAELEKRALSLKILGSYPKGKLFDV